MKKLFALLMAVMMILSVAACSPKVEKKDEPKEDKQVEEKKDEKKDEEKKDEKKDEEKKDEKKDEEKKDEEKKDEKKEEAKQEAPADATTHVFYYNYSDVYISSVRAALDKAFEGLDLKYKNYDSNASQATQNEQVQTALTDNAALLVVNQVETAAEDAALDIRKQAEEKQIPIIFFNREVTDNVVKGYDKCVFVGTDAAEAGHMQGKMIGDYVVAHFDEMDLNKDGKISYIMFKGQQGNPEADARTKYGVEDADKVLVAAGKPELVFYDENNKDKFLLDQGGNWSAAAANELMTTALSQYNEDNKNMIELVICNNDGMAEGAISALEAAGYNKGVDKDGKLQGYSVPVFGVDATDAAKELIAQKKMTGTIKQDAEGMANTIALIVKNFLTGKPYNEGVTAPIDENVAKVRIPYQVYTGE